MKKNDWDCNVIGDAVEGPVVCVSIEDVLHSLNKMKTGEASGPSETSLVDCCLSGSRNSSDS